MEGKTGKSIPSLMHNAGMSFILSSYIHSYDGVLFSSYSLSPYQLIPPCHLSRI